MATTTIPIVFASVGDPLRAGLIESFARPGSNITGVTDLTHALGGKRLEVFQTIIPAMKRILFPYDASDPASVAEAAVYRDAARRLGIELVELALQTPEAAQKALDQIHQGEVDGILAPRCCSFNIPGLILKVAAKRSIPSMFRTQLFVEQLEGLASYGPNAQETGRQATRIIDKIIKGVKPAEIPGVRTLDNFIHQARCLSACFVLVWTVAGEAAVFHPEWPTAHGWNRPLIGIRVVARCAALAA